MSFSNRLKVIKWWFYHRFHPSHKYNTVHTNLPPGYYECDERLLYSCFAILKEYVEHQAAWMALICNDEERSKVPWWMSYHRYNTIHNKRLALHYLTYWNNVTEEEADRVHCMGPKTLHDKRAEDKEVLDLYLWWTETYSNRPDPYENCYEYSRDYIKAITSDENLDKAFKQEEAYFQEDEDMLIRLMKVRRYLWT